MTPDSPQTPLTAEEEAEYREHFIDGSGAYIDRQMVARLLVTIDAARREARADFAARLREAVLKEPGRVDVIARAAVLRAIEEASK